MEIAEAQRGMREAYRRGSVGQLVSAAVWVGAAEAASAESAGNGDRIRIAGIDAVVDSGM